MIASVLNAAQSFVLLLAIQIICGPYEGGIFSIASTVSYQLLAIGNYNMRNYQVTDVKGRYSFGEYITSRIITVSLMVLSGLIYIMIMGYSFEKSIVILAYSLYKGVDAIEDIFHGQYQQYGRLDVGGMIESIRYFVSITVYIVTLYFTRSQFTACISALCITLIIFITCNLHCSKDNLIIIKREPASTKYLHYSRTVFHYF